MVLTDMVSDNGWDSNRAMVLLKSTDLVNWSHSVINMQKRYPGQEKLKRVWAPQTIYNKEVGKYMVYWSMQYAGGVDVIYYAYANEDFTDLEGEPKPLFIPKDKKSCIDGDIVYKDGVYHLFYKTEGHGNGIKVATTRSLTSENGKNNRTINSRQRKRWKERYVQTDWTGQVHSDVRCIHEGSLSVHGNNRLEKLQSDRSCGEDEFPSSSWYHHSYYPCRIETHYRQMGKPAELGELR